MAENTGTSIDTSYRLMSVETLNALRLSALSAIESISGVGQSYSGNGRQTSHASLAQYTRQLANCDAALAYKRGVDAPYGAGYASRFTDLSCERP